MMLHTFHTSVAHLHFFLGQIKVLCLSFGGFIVEDSFFFSGIKAIYIDHKAKGCKNRKCLL